MAKITLKGNLVHTSGELLKIGDVLADFILVSQDLQEKSFANFSGKKKVLNIFPSLDTGVCAATVKTFYEKLNKRDDVIVINISKDLPFAQKRFCTSEGIGNAITLSAFRTNFAKNYGLEIVDGPLKGLCSRAVIVTDEHNKVVYTEQVPEIAQEPDYDKVLAALG